MTHRPTRLKALKRFTSECSGKVPGHVFDSVACQEVVGVGERVTILEALLVGLATSCWMGRTDHLVWWLIDRDRRCLADGMRAPQEEGNMGALLVDHLEHEVGEVLPATSM